MHNYYGIAWVKSHKVTQIMLLSDHVRQRVACWPFPFDFRSLDLLCLTRVSERHPMLCYYD